MKRVGDLLKEFLRARELALCDSYSTLFNRWDSLAGEPLSLHSQVVDVVHNTLVVEVDHPGWLQLLQMKQNGIVKAVSESFPSLDIKGIRGIVSRGQQRAPGPVNGGAPATEDEKGEDSIAEADPALAYVKDEELREILRKFFRTVVARKEESES